ncbi:MAG TPA: sugar transferase [Baekduia sp.]|uniref:sugar transferase n=1 Tax=Baekduia sp. TaxID=2600305 RepID=UPI002D77B7A6|nr:sugar transferase [Baekduia sp.]HET6508236.1 sugar transferase [Baekduia sp.]
MDAISTSHPEVLIAAGADAFVDAAPTRRTTAVACRALDVAVSAVLLIVLVPVFAVIAVAIRLDTPGRVVYRQKRVGRGLKPFTLNKFRSMHDGASHAKHQAYVEALIKGDQPDQGGDKPFYKLSEDERVTRVGRVLRKTSLDELPQLWNVLCGNMSLVGPRPCLHYELEAYPAHWFGRFAVKPGITGAWQVGGRSEIGLEDMIALDIEYAAQRSFWLNVKILLRTVPVVLNRRGAA